MRLGLGCVSCFVPLLILSAAAEAQINGSAEAARRPYIGAFVGAGEVPVTFFDGCVSEGRHDARSNSASLELSAGLPIGPVALESRTTARGEPPLTGRTDCFSLEPSHESGIHTDGYRVDPGAFSATDLRLVYELPLRVRVTASAGAGWVWARDVPFLTGSLGIRTAGRTRWGGDIVWDRYRMPFGTITREWERYRVVRELSRDAEHVWQDAWSVRLGAEWQLPRRPS